MDGPFDTSPRSNIKVWWLPDHLSTTQVLHAPSFVSRAQTRFLKLELSFTGSNLHSQQVLMREGLMVVMFVLGRDLLVCFPRSRWGLPCCRRIAHEMHDNGAQPDERVLGLPAGNVFEN